MNQNTKTLITGGCSFTENTWPSILNQKLNYKLFNEALSSQGNGLISKRIIYRVSEALKTTPAENILVGIMWSGFTRHEIFLDETINFNAVDGAVLNPVKFINDTSIDRHWLILNHGWKNEYAKRFYSDFSFVGSIILTIEHILRTQWFLKNHNIKYFMTTFTSETIPKDFINHPEINYLYEQINFDYFLPILGEFEWCNNIQENILIHTWPPNWSHPSQAQHKNFVENCVLPFLQNKNLL